MIWADEIIAAAGGSRHSSFYVRFGSAQNTKAHERGVPLPDSHTKISAASRILYSCLVAKGRT